MKKKILPVMKLLLRLKLRMVSRKLKPARWIFHHLRLHHSTVNNSPAHLNSNQLARFVNVTSC